MSIQQSAGKIKVKFTEAIGMIFPYAVSKFKEQIQSVSLIVLYLVFFQIIILGIPVAESAVIALGIGLVVAGLAFFMEGLLIGLMPLGEICGIKLPQKSGLLFILIFSFVLGMGVTFAEPAIGVLKAAGSSVKAWDAPLLFLLLNKYSNYLVYAVAIGVGIAVVFGMLRFLYGWSLKPFIYIFTLILIPLSIWAFFDPNMMYVTGVAWDCGGVTTGPVTVPLVIALGIGISRIVVKKSGASSGFGVVTLASAFPVITVMLLGLILNSGVPKPMHEESFFHPSNRAKTIILFENEDKMTGYALKNSSDKGVLSFFNNNGAQMNSFMSTLALDSQKRKAVFGNDEEYFRWKGQSAENASMAGPIFIRNGILAVQAIIPLCILLVLVLVIILREKLPRFDEVILGISFAVIGLGLFNAGIELGLSKLGNQVGEKLPSSFKAISLTDQKQVINGFDLKLLQRSLSPDGTTESFFYTKLNQNYVALPFDVSNYNPVMKQYSFVPKRGPLFGNEGGLWGILIVLLFGFIMGYGATLAEPALNALGIKVEELTVGTFKKSLLMQAVAVGVGIGIAVGVAKIIWNIPLIFLLTPPYLILLLITKISSEEFVNIGWDSAGVTTGPITVPLVLAMGLGIGGQVGVVEGFGILACASVFPILSVLLVGLYVNQKRRTDLQVTK
jgi:hypothetical protein